MPAAPDSSLDVLKGQRVDTRSGTADLEDADTTQPLEFPGADLSFLSDDELSVPVVPKQPGEFTCSKCFLVHPRNRLARGGRNRTLCRDCV